MEITLEKLETIPKSHYSDTRTRQKLLEHLYKNGNVMQVQDLAKFLDDGEMFMVVAKLADNKQIANNLIAYLLDTSRDIYDKFDMPDDGLSGSNFGIFEYVTNLIEYLRDDVVDFEIECERRVLATSHEYLHDIQKKILDITTADLTIDNQLDYHRLYYFGLALTGTIAFLTGSEKTRYKQLVTICTGCKVADIGYKDGDYERAIIGSYSTDQEVLRKCLEYATNKFVDSVRECGAQNENN